MCSSSFNCWINAWFFASTSDSSTFLDLLVVGFAMFLSSSRFPFWFDFDFNGFIIDLIELPTPLDLSPSI